MTATTSVERDSLIRVIKTAALMSVMLEAQMTIHENHVWTDGPEISFGLVTSTRSLELLNKKIILRLGNMIGTDAAKSAFNEALQMLCDEQIDTLDQLTTAILNAIGEGDDA